MPTIELKKARLCVNCNLLHEGWTCPRCGENGFGYFIEPWLNKTLKQIEEMRDRIGGRNGNQVKQAHA